MKTNSNHTPGPWRIGDAGKTVFGPKTDAPSPVTIASIAPSSRTTPEEKQANAQLIAAAPTMYNYLSLLASRGDNEAHEIIKSIARS
jgi:hypothetical protein